jgi:hypothetical protein
MGQIRTRVYVTFVAVVLALSGCGGSDEKVKTPTSASPNLPPPTTTLPVPAPLAHPTAGRLPSAISQLESSAEDLVDFARARNRAKVVKGAGKLRDLAQGGAERALTRDKAAEGLIEALKGQAQATAQLAPSAAFLQVALAANQVSSFMPVAYSYYTYPVPPAVLKLDYLDREAQLRSIANDPALTQRAVNQLSTTWNKLRSEVVKAGGGKEAARYSAHVAAIRRLGESFDRPAIRKEAGRGLQLVDELEDVFRR